MKNFIRLFILGGVMMLVFACDNDEVAPAPKTDHSELSMEATQQIEVNQYLDEVRSLGFGAPGAILQDKSGLIGGRVTDASSWKRMRSFIHNGRSVNDGVCVAQIFVLNDDGSFTWVIDFGDGCEIDGEFWKGKVVETYHIDEEAKTYRAFIAFEDFGKEAWNINGLAALEGSYQDINGFSTEFSFVKDLEVEGEDEFWSIKQVGQESLTEEAWTILEMVADINYRNLSNEDALSYRNLVIVPLVYDFTCGDHIITFVSGIDAVKVNHKEVILLFGEGECDNFVTIKEGILEIVVDVSQEELD